MPMTRSANPALNKNTFGSFGQTAVSGKTMTIEGTVNKAVILLGCVLLTSFYSWSNPSAVVLMPVGIFGGLIFAFITIFKKKWAGITGPLYALCEGLFLGTISMYFESRYPGIVMNAVVLTFGTLITLLLAYRSRLIKVTENFRLGIVAATGGIFMLYMASFILRFFEVHMTFLHDSSLLSIGISFAVVIVAALNLVLDFDFIERGAEYGAPKYMEWYGAFGLMVTLIWLYIEMLHLLSKLRSRR